MELRGQENSTGMRMGYSSSSAPVAAAATASSTATLAERRRANDQTGGGSTVFTPAQTLDHHHLHQEQLLILQQHKKHAPVAIRDSIPDPDQVADPSAAISAATNSIPPLAATNLAATSTVIASIRYRECLKNHAANSGGHVVDGCGEFMPSGEEGTPEATKCAACDCHRNFHRREAEGESQSGAKSYYPYYNTPNRNSTSRTTAHRTQFPQSVPPPTRHHQQQQHRRYYNFSTSPGTGQIPPVMMTFGGVPVESTSEDLNMFHANAGTQLGAAQPFSPGTKRFRTKFSEEQKERMREFAERIGWKMQKQDEQQLNRFCDELGVKRQVFKVWMHNNKQAMKRKQL